MEVLRFSGLTRHYGANEVFADLNGVLREGDRIGLVGPNGAGKSSLVRLLAGADEPDGGSIDRTKGRRLGYLAQDAAERGPQTLRAAFEEALERGDAAEWEMRATLNRFDFAEADLDRSLGEFSGGQRTRALLARTLLESPDWLILDEPTNHLDLDTVRWLETFVARDPRAFVIVSHDRYFLETVANQIWELDRGELAIYDVQPGRAYGDYLEQRELRRAQQQRDFETYQSERKRQKAVIAELKTHGSHNYSHVRSREKSFAKVAAVDAPRVEKRAIGVTLRASRRATGGPAIDVTGLTKSYDHTLFSNLTASFVRGDRVAIVGPNGAGKSTFLRIISGDLAADAGSVKYGVGLRTAGYSQSSVDDLPARATASEAVMQMGVTDGEARSLLGRLNLGGDSGDKPVEAFSGGERRRIMLARLMAQRADCLFLDEPTNDLDIPSREALEDVLASYEGTLFVVSHDRYLLKRLAERVVSIRDGAASVYDGDYDEYERRAHSEKSVDRARSGADRAKNGTTNGKGRADNGTSGSAGADRRNGKNTAANGSSQNSSAPASIPLDRRAAHEAKLELGRRTRAVADAEKRVARLEREKTTLEQLFAAPDLYDQPAEIVRLRGELDRVNAESEAALESWEVASDALEGFTKTSATQTV